MFLLENCQLMRPRFKPMPATPKVSHQFKNMKLSPLHHGPGPAWRGCSRPGCCCCPRRRRRQGSCPFGWPSKSFEAAGTSLTSVCSHLRASPSASPKTSPRTSPEKLRPTTCRHRCKSRSDIRIEVHFRWIESFIFKSQKKPPSHEMNPSEVLPTNEQKFFFLLVSRHNFLNDFCLVVCFPICKLIHFFRQKKTLRRKVRRKKKNSKSHFFSIFFVSGYFIHFSFSDRLLPTNKRSKAISN